LASIKNFLKKKKRPDPNLLNGSVKNIDVAEFTLTYANRHLVSNVVYLKRNNNKEPKKCILNL